MSREEFQKPYKQRFKGVETFLRRVAFNLGNTASQTEVKIISCIPIDVTDLQQKIISLEKQLHEAQQRGTSVDEKLTEKTKDKPSAVVNTALYGPSFTKQSSTVSYCSNKPIETIKSGVVASCCGSLSSRPKKSNVSFIFPALSAPDTEKSSDFKPRKGFSNENAAAIERCKNIFRKRKRKKDYRGNSKVKTHWVYYAQTDNSFNVKDVPVSMKCSEILKSSDKLCMSHISNVIRRQYDPNEVEEEFSDTSNFSRPICRDIVNKCQHLNHYDSDVCSCCHGKFQNIDNYMAKTNYDLILTNLHNFQDDTKVYYDSKHYDIIPVKENNNKLIKYNFEQKKDNKRLEIKCWPEPLRTKQKCIYPFINNYNTETSAKRHPNKRQPIQEKSKLQKMNINQDKIKKSEQRACSETSKSCYIDYSDIYPKQEQQQPKSRKTDIVKSITRKNESVETDDVVTKLEVSNQSTQLELFEDCRDITLNEIKTILQSVLEEVKTNTKLNKIGEIVKRDAVVQKGESNNSMPGDSTLLHSYTYNNSYNANPYLPSCSKQIPPSQYYVPNVPYQPVKCLQNYPIFIQPTSGRHLCTCYYRKGSCKPQNKPATAAAINTAPDTNNNINMSTSKETEKLIKEIYNSMALNMDFPTKDSSTSEYNDLKSDKISNNVMDDKSKDTRKNKNDIVKTMVSPIQSVINQNAPAGDTKQIIKTNFIKAESTGNINKDKYVQRLELNYVRSSDTIVENEEEMEEFSEESDSDSTVILEELEQHKKQGKGFFSRMLKSVNLFKKKKQTLDEKEASDSDDYETIYSEKSANIPRYNTTKEYIKPRNFDPNDKNKTKRPPYLEQEYRRHWNERLAFRERESKCTSERPISRSSMYRTRPVYWNDYEARSAIVNHKLADQLKAEPQCIKQDTLQKIEPLKKTNKGGLGWLRKHKMGINCGEQWKKLIFEN